MLTFMMAWAFVLLPLPWILRWLLPPAVRDQPAVQVPFGDRLQTASKGNLANAVLPKRDLKHLFFILVWGSVVVALARPQWIEPPVTKDKPTRDLLLLVDLSGSMQEEDFTNEAGEKVDRLSAVKDVVGDFLANRKGDRVGLVVFGDAPFLQAPFSTDLDIAKRLLDETAVGMAGPQTALGDAIGLGISLFENSDAPTKTLIALTDGNDTKSQVPPVEAARIAHQRDIRIYTVAIGDATTVGEDKIDETTLREVAEETDGKFFFASDRAELKNIYAELDKLETKKVDVVSFRPRRDLYFWPLAFALLCSALDKGMVILRSRRGRAVSTDTASVRVLASTGKLEVIQR